MATSMKPAMYIDIDTDLYIGAKQALAWMFENKLVVPGTLVGYDDWSTGGEGGQQRAHAEVVRKHGLSVRRLEGKGREPCFEVVSVRSFRGAA